MLSKRFYDIFSILLVVLFIFSAWYLGNVNSQLFQEKWEASDKSDAISVTLSVYEEPSYKIANYINLGVRILAGIYWIFIVVLAIQFYKKELVSMLDVIIIVLLAPLAIVFYFLTLRGKYKKLLK